MTLRILIADDEAAARFGLTKALAAPNRVIAEAADGQEALELIRTALPDLVFLDLSMPILNGQAVLRELQKDRPKCEIIIVTANDTVQSAVECMHLGAADYIAKPYEVEQLRAIARRVERRLELERRVDDLQGRLEEKHAFGALVGVSRPMADLFRQMERAARAPLDILLRGETGTGKELIAREIHRLSERAGRPFVAVNTAAIPDTLVESELFGHERGAFTGADTARKGVFEQAAGGTLFLDEIGDMPLAAQTKILRALQERVVQPVGSSRSVPVDVRVISATHQDLSQAIGEGHFRQDLYYRIRGVELLVPPLRSRREDILLLANHFLDRLAAKKTTACPRLSADAAGAVLAYSWPGNVRELEQRMVAASTMTSDAEIQVADLHLPGAAEVASTFDLSAWLGIPLTEAKNKLAEAFERQAITHALEKNGGNVSAAARQLGIHRQSLQQKMDQYGMARKVRRV